MVVMGILMRRQMHGLGNGCRSLPIWDATRVWGQVSLSDGEELRQAGAGLARSAAVAALSRGLWAQFQAVAYCQASTTNGPCHHLDDQSRAQHWPINATGSQVVGEGYHTPVLTHVDNVNGKRHAKCVYPATWADHHPLSEVQGPMADQPAVSGPDVLGDFQVIYNRALPLYVVKFHALYAWVSSIAPKTSAGSWMLALSSLSANVGRIPVGCNRPRIRPSLTPVCWKR